MFAVCPLSVYKKIAEKHFCTCLLNYNIYKNIIQIITINSLSN